MGDLNEQIADIEDHLEQREAIEDEHESIQEQLTALRTRVDRIEEEAVEKFSDHIASLLEILEYSHIGRIWIERRDNEDRDCHRKITQTIFDHQIVRSTDGSAYRHSVDHFSKSEPFVQHGPSGMVCRGISHLHA